MKYEGDVNYAADPYGYRPPETPKRKGLLGLGLAVAGIVAFTGTILFVYRGSDRMNADGTPPLLTADASPAKSRPDQPGGMEVPHQDKLVYERLHEKGTQPNIERLLPPPEAPLPRPVVTPAMPGPTPLPSAPAIAQMPPPPPGSTATVPRDTVGQPPAQAAAAPQSGNQQQAGAKPAPAKPTPTPAPAPANAAASAQRQTVVPQPPKAPPAPPAASAPAATAQPTAAQAAKPVPVSTAALPPPAPASQPAGQQAAIAQPVAQPPKPPATGGGAGNWRVQPASVRSESEATAEWKRLAGKHADALGGVGMQIVKADLGEKGVFYRVQGGGIDENRAKSVCAQLRAQNVGCVVVRP